MPASFPQGAHTVYNKKAGMSIKEMLFCERNGSKERKRIKIHFGAKKCILQDNAGGDSKKSMEDRK